MSTASSARTPLRPDVGITSASRMSPPSAPPVRLAAAESAGVCVGTVVPSSTRTSRERWRRTVDTNDGAAGSTDRLRSVSVDPFSASASTAVMLNSVAGSAVRWSIATDTESPHSPGLDAAMCSAPPGPEKLFADVAARVAAPRVTRTITASLPPFWKYWRTAKLIRLSTHSPPKMRAYSGKLWISTASSTGPLRARPTKAVVDVLTPTIGRTPLGNSSM